MFKSWKEYIVKRRVGLSVFLEIIVFCGGAYKIGLLNFDQVSVTEGAYEALKQNTIALQALTIGAGRPEYLEDAKKRIENATQAILKFSGSVVPLCHFEEGRIPNTSGGPSIPFRNLNITARYIGPAGPLVDQDVASQIMKLDGTKCENQITDEGIIRAFVRSTKYGSYLDWVLLFCTLILLILKYLTYKIDREYPFKRKFPRNMPRYLRD